MMQTVVAHEGLLSLGACGAIYRTTASAFSSIQLATRYVVPLVQATERGSGAGSFRRLTVDISSSPSSHRALRGCWAPTLASSKPPVSLSKQRDIPGAYWAAPLACTCSRILFGQPTALISDDCNNWKRTTQHSRQRWSASNASCTKVLSSVTEQFGS